MDPHAILMQDTNDNKLMHMDFKNESAIAPSSNNYNLTSAREHLTSHRKFLDESSMTMQRFVNEMTGND